MSKYFSTDTPFFHRFSTLADLVLLNLLTLLCSLPVFTAGAAFTSLFHAVSKLREGDGGIYKSYFQSFKNNFKQATILWLLLLVIGGGACFCILVYYQANLPIPLGCSVLLLVIWGIVVSWLFPLLSRFYSTTFGALRNAILCGINYLPLSVAMTVVNMVPIFLFLFAPQLFLQLLCLWLFIWFSFAAYCNTGLLKVPFSVLLPEDSKE